MEGLDHRDTVTDFTLPEETFFDCAMVHLLTTATLDRLRELYPQGRFEVRRFRPNIVVQLGSSEKSFAENAWVGRTLAIGTAACLNRSEEHTSELQSPDHLVYRLLIEKKKNKLTYLILLLYI